MVSSSTTPQPQRLRGSLTYQPLPKPGKFSLSSVLSAPSTVIDGQSGSRTEGSQIAGFGKLQCRMDQEMRTQVPFLNFQPLYLKHFSHLLTSNIGFPTPPPCRPPFPQQRATTPLPGQK